MPYAEVSVNSPIPAQQTFTYQIPPGLKVEVGHGVYIPFGKRTLQGVVLEVTETPTFADTRDIESVIEEMPLLLPHQIPLVRWLADYYLAPLYDCASLMLPPAFSRKPLVFLSVAEAQDGIRLSERQAAALNILREKGRLEVGELAKVLRVRRIEGLVENLLQKGLVERSYELARPRVGVKTVPQLRLLISPLDAVERIKTGARQPKQRERLEAAVAAASESREGLPLVVLRSRVGLTREQARWLCDRGIAAQEDVPSFRDPLAGKAYEPREPPLLTANQEQAYESIAAALSRSGADRAIAFLLHGVTGSGKTEVYLQALAKAVELGGKAIVLVPEISLTPQTVRRFAERFPGRVAVMHSGLSLGEHYDVWQAVREGRYDVVIGPRSAIFAPQPDLSLIIVDEEHEWTYKQEEMTPRYDARLVATKLSELAGAALVMGSATPSVESYYHATAGRYQLLELPLRVQPTAIGIKEAPLPAVEVVDLREELRAGNRGSFSRRLLKALDSVLSAHEQAILFLNRRGSAAFAQCRDCGYVPACSRCAVSLSYHSSDSAAPRLLCHHCNRSLALPPVCPRCGGPRLRLLGSGTERIEAEVRSHFPGVRTLRWDRDTAKRPADHERILSGFLAHEADVLVGTQMLAKGLDMPGVTLVGIVSADIALHLPDFRSSERTFQVLEQVAGRAGRGERSGRVIVQTYSPDHPAIAAAAKHDYTRLYQQEVRLRERLRYPPFGRLLRLTFVHGGQSSAEEEALKRTVHLKEECLRLGLPDLDILGPAPASPPRLRGRWRWNITLRGRDPAALLRQTRLPQGWQIDVDPGSLL